MTNNNDRLAKALGVPFCRGCGKEIPDYRLQEETQVTAADPKGRRIDLIAGHFALHHSNHIDVHDTCAWLVFSIHDNSANYHVALTAEDIHG